MQQKRRDTNTYNTVITMTSIDSVRYSEQEAPMAPLNIGGRGDSEERPEANGRTRDSIVRQVMLRDQVQSALSELIRNYEEITGLSVIRVIYQQETHRVTIEAIPAK
jgi:hypothetical protein